MAFQQGLSGLSAASKALDVTGNNVANSATVGFKAGTTHFADVYANSLAGSGSSVAGIGTMVRGVQQQFSQGNITTTNNSLDISINGNGFYRMSSNGTITYSRSGQFHLDKDGYIVDDQSRRLTGYSAVNGQVVTSSATDLQVSSANIDPVATGSTGKGVTADLNFDSGSKVPTPTSGTFSISDPTSYNWSTATSIYDSLGKAHTLTLYAVSTATAGTWDIYTSVDGTAPANSGLSPNPGTLTFDTSGHVTGTGLLNASVDLTQVMSDQSQTNKASSPLAFNIDFSGSTQYGSDFATNSLQQDGYTTGSLSSVSVSGDGIVQGKYSNGKTRDLGQVVLVNFTNPNGLASLGNNQWAETSASGSPAQGTPKSGNLGALQSSSVEESNVDLTAELVNLITEQRNYQANAKTIEAQNAIMQTLVSMT